jgi:hypothetical protein
MWTFLLKRKKEKEHLARLRKQYNDDEEPFVSGCVSRYITTEIRRGYRPSDRDIINRYLECIVHKNARRKFRRPGDF